MSAAGLWRRSEASSRVGRRPDHTHTFATSESPPQRPSSASRLSASPPSPWSASLCCVASGARQAGPSCAPVCAPTLRTIIRLHSDAGRFQFVARAGPRPCAQHISSHTSSRRGLSPPRSPPRIVRVSRRFSSFSPFSRDRGLLLLEPDRADRPAPRLDPTSTTRSPAPFVLVLAALRRSSSTSSPTARRTPRRRSSPSSPSSPRFRRGVGSPGTFSRAAHGLCRRLTSSSRRASGHADVPGHRGGFDGVVRRPTHASGARRCVEALVHVAAVGGR